MIQVKKISDGRFEVSVPGETTTTHQVTMESDYYQRLTGGKETEEEFIARAFEFLLHREPNTAILGSFELPVIGRYFPEFEKEIRK